MKKVAIKVFVVAAVAVASFLLASSLYSANGADAGKTPSAPAAARTMPDRGVSGGTIAALRALGITVSPVSEAVAAKTVTKITKADVLTRAAGSFGFVNDGKATGISLVHLTDSMYGKKLETDPAKPTRIEPKIKNKLVWVVEFHDFTPFVSKPLVDPIDPPRPLSHDTAPKANGSMLVAIDPANGDVIWGQQF